MRPGVFLARLIVLALTIPLGTILSAAEAGPGAGDRPHGRPVVLLPKTAFAPSDLAVVVNEDDLLSIRIGDYYRARRGIPDQNVIRVRFRPGRSVIDRQTFVRIRDEVERQTPERAQAYALTWAFPYRVGCMSITSAFAFGFDPAYCAEGCRPTRRSTYYDTDTLRPYQDLGMRPTMSIAATHWVDAKALIDRGVASDETWPAGTGYLVDTRDTDRNVRARTYEAIVEHMKGNVRVEHLKADYLEGRPDVLFYFTGSAVVPRLDSNRFVAGAIADHLTSAGGRLEGKRQMSVLRWLQRGATGSYGTVIEPCNYPQKFPQPAMVIDRYTGGQTLIEAYWKSVAMPGQGLFVGEPLARPYGGYRAEIASNSLVVKTRLLKGDGYEMQASNGPIGPFHTVTTRTRVSSGVRAFYLERPPVPEYLRVISPRNRGSL